MKTKLLTFMLLGIFLISFVAAQVCDAEIPPVKLGDKIEFTQVCDNCTQVNLTKIVYPNQSFYFLGQIPMTQNGTNYNYSFSDTNTLGVWYYTTTGNLNGNSESQSVCFHVTPSGTILGLEESILYVVLILINLLVFGFFLYWTITIPYSNKTNERGDITKVTKTKYLKLFSALLCYGSFLWFVALFTGITNNFISLDIFKNLISNLYIVLSGIGVGFTFLIMTVLFIEVWRDILFNKEIQKYGKAIINQK